jgi:hypothetical protein
MSLRKRLPAIARTSLVFKLAVDRRCKTTSLIVVLLPFRFMACCFHIVHIVLPLSPHFHRHLTLRRYDLRGDPLVDFVLIIYNRLRTYDTGILSLPFFFYLYLLRRPCVPVRNGKSSSMSCCHDPSSIGKAWLAPSISTSWAWGTSFLIL